MFRDLPSSKCPVSVEMSMLDLETYSSGSIPTRGNILLLDFFCFHVVKPLMPILALLPISSSLFHITPTTVGHSGQSVLFAN